jgi:hypothetical protein
MRPRSVATHYRDRGVPMNRVIGRVGDGTQRRKKKKSHRVAPHECKTAAPGFQFL